MESVIEIQGLGKTFANKRVVRDLNLRVPKGSIFALLGANGAGKTTTIRMLLGILTPTQGSCTVLGLDSQRQGVELRQRVGYVDEQTTMYPYMRVREIISFNAGLYPTWNQTLATRYLDQFDLPLNSRIRELSKGMRTQLALTLALSSQPELLILDEPTSSLDPVWRRQFLQVLTEEVAGGETTVLFSSHILSDVERVADWVAILSHGRLQTVRPLEEIKYNERKIRVVFQASPPEGLLTQPGIRTLERQGNGYLLTVEDNFDTIYSSLSRTPHFVLEVVEQDLESIFLEHSGAGGGSIV